MADLKNTQSARSNEPEEIKFEEIKGGKFQPFVEPVVDNLNRPQQPHVATDGQPLPEPDFSKSAPPKIDLNMGNGGSGSGGDGGGTTPPRHTHNDGDTIISDDSEIYGRNFREEKKNVETELPDKDKLAAAEATADMILTIYCQVKAQIPNWISISEKKLNKLQKEGLINLKLNIQASPYSPEVISVGAFIQNFNTTLFPPFQTNPQFIEQIKPPLVRILLKNNAVMSDDSIVIFFLIQDAVGVVVNVVQCMGQRNEMLDHLKTLTEQSKPVQTATSQANAMANAQAAATYSNAATPPPPPPPSNKDTTTPPKVHIVASEPEEKGSTNSNNASVASNTGMSGIYPFPPTKIRTKRKPGGGRKKGSTTKNKKDSIEILATEPK